MIWGHSLIGCHGLSRHLRSTDTHYLDKREVQTIAEEKIKRDRGEKVKG